MKDRRIVLSGAFQAAPVASTIGHARGGGRRQVASGGEDPARAGEPADRLPLLNSGDGQERHHIFGITI
jgi:hypothetical protein